MAKFRNKTTGNIVNTENEVTIGLMKKSDNYEEVKSETKKTGKETKNIDKTDE